MINNVKEVDGNNFNITRSAEETRNLSFNNNICLGCGICESTCAVGAINLSEIGTISRKKTIIAFSGHDKIKQNLFNTDKSQNLDIDEDKCVLCGMCSGMCPVDALELTINDIPIKEIDAYPSYDAGVEIDDELCVYCQKCETACPKDALTIERALPNRADLVTGEISVDEHECIHCGVCSELCPAEAITVNKETGEESIVIDTDKCVYCLVCKKACPVDAISAICRLCPYEDYDLDPNNAIVTGSQILDKDLCITCGWCQYVCPTDAVNVKQPFAGSFVIDQDKCQACGSCVDTCECHALAFPVSTEPGQRLDHVMINENVCLHCGACAKICPNGALNVKRTTINCTPVDSITWQSALDAIKN